MRFIAIALLALLVSVSFAQGPVTDGSSSVSGLPQTYWATYDNTFHQLLGGSDKTNIDVTATVPYFATETLEGRSIDFVLTSMSSTTKLMSVGLKNNATCNFPFSIYLAPTAGCPNIQILKWDNSGGFVTDAGGATVIGVKWYWSTDGGTNKTPATPDQPVPGAIQGPSFSSGPQVFHWYAELAPNDNQRPGAYSLDPVVAVYPEI